MFCHRKSSLKPDSALIGRFQRLYDKEMICKPTDSNGAKINSSEGQGGMTPSQGANKRPKGNSDGTSDFFTFDGYAPTDNLQSLITEQWLTPQTQAPSQSKDMALQDAIDRSQPPTNLQQNFPRRDDMGPMMDWQFEDLSGGQVGANFQGSVNPSQLWSGIDPVAPQNVLTPNEFANQGSYDGNMRFAAQCFDLDQPLSNQLPLDTVGGLKDDLLQRSQYTKFRYHTILRASTAMVNTAEDSPVSYLNKGQVYQLTVEDTNPAKMDTGSNQYQTFVRISFDEEQQRSDPAISWQLWRAGRASNEYRESDEEPTAVQYAGPNNSLMHVEREIHDGFTVNWTKNPGEDVARCSIPIRFNFLSTDFTLSKGVKGMQLRLCAKTKQLWENKRVENETSFCNVKLFRDHGAERKLTNDATSIRKKMDKLKLQLNEPAPPESMNKRKRNSLTSKLKPDDSLSDQNLSAIPKQTSHQNQLQKRLEAMQISAQSCLPENSLDIRAAEKDDPELHPTQHLHPTLEVEDRSDNRRSSSAKSSYQNSDSMEKEMPGSSAATSNIGEAFDDALSNISGGSEQLVGPAACFYIKLCKNDEPPTEYYRAIYPRQRTVDDLKSSLSHKILPDPADIAQILYINPAGLKVVVDDEFVHEIAEGQSMILRIIDIPPENVSNSGGKYEIRLEY
ncbi:hypothetical protein PENSTE_c002G08878 [Penicillium steckii]|uniref:Grh/CP2 DB domain-containing protein n=1 Tax=Penicillium steckii TaxID=303698 RepID=A0A1V6TSW4_9EURO|nr:hypothetical protein PENSTE_c002G08878 [Penicillium steckii]